MLGDLEGMSVTGDREGDRLGDLEGESIIGALVGACEGDRLGLDDGYKMNEGRERE